MLEALSQNPLLALFVTIGIGYAIGRLKFFGYQLGVVAVLFIGLAFGALSNELKIDAILIYFGLSIYIYSIGLASGPSFFNNFNAEGSRHFGLIFLMLTFTIALCMGLAYWFDFPTQSIAGLYAGSTTNTPALAGLIDLFGQLYQDPTQLEMLSNDAVAAYSLSYPLGIAGTIIALVICKKLFKIDYDDEAEQLKDRYPVKQDLRSCTILIKGANEARQSIRDLKQAHNWKVIFGRLERKGDTLLSSYDTIFEDQDKIVAVGEKKEIERVGQFLGEVLKEDISTDQEHYRVKRIFVSNPEIAGQPISTLNIQEKFSAIVTRVQRGDIDLLASSDTVLELGDIIQFVVRKRDLKGLKELFGDSYESLGTVNLFSYGFGLALGLFFGMITFSLPGGISFKLGFAGGPMIIALILGRLRRTGNIVWTLPFSANLTLQQLGLALMLAGIGINSGHTFITTLSQSSSLLILVGAAVLSFASAAFALALGYKVLRIPFSILTGMVSHQPAILDYNLEQTNNKLPIVGYTLMMPVALILKVIYVQVLYVLLN